MTCSAWMSQATLRDMIKYLNSELLNLLLNYKLDIYSYIQLRGDFDVNSFVKSTGSLSLELVHQYPLKKDQFFLFSFGLQCLLHIYTLTLTQDVDFCPKENKDNFYKSTSIRTISCLDNNNLPKICILKGKSMVDFHIRKCLQCPVK